MTAEASVAYSFLITWREGLEAGLILAITLSYLAHIDQKRYWLPIWLGAAFAFLGSLVAGIVLEATATSLSGEALEGFEGGAMLLAVAVLTTMIFWMKSQAASIGAYLRQQVDVALRSGSALALAALAFTAVGREGLETVLFLFAGSSTADSSSLYWTGAGTGLAMAVALSYTVYVGAARLPLGAFFNLTGMVLIVLAAGLLVNGLKELHEIGAIGSLGPHLWDTYHIIADNSQLGRFLSTILGYDSSPYLGLVVAYLAYLVLALAFFALGRGRPLAAPSGRLMAAPGPQPRSNEE
jgi:high-affinity iron transporter